MIQPQKTPMRQQDPKVRIHNFDEVPLGYSEEEAVREAERCLQCKNAPCIAGCPVSIDIPRFIEQVKNRQFAEAIATIKESNSLPAGEPMPRGLHPWEALRAGGDWEVGAVLRRLGSRS